MSNFSISHLVIASYISRSPFLTTYISSNEVHSTFFRIEAHNLISKFFFSQSILYSLTFSSSSFFKSLTTPLYINSQENEIIFYTTHQNFGNFIRIYSQNNIFSLFKCSFSNIHEPYEMGGSFLCISSSCSLNVSHCSFIHSTTEGSGYVGTRFMKIGGGAFVFDGRLSNIEYTCFINCSAIADTMTFAIRSQNVLEISKVHSILLFNNGQQSLGSNTFSCDTGSFLVEHSNVTNNKILGSYAGGYIGWFAGNSTFSYVEFSANEGKCISGISSHSISGGSLYINTHFFSNKATSYGVLMRLSGYTICQNMVMMNNIGSSFYGIARLVLRNCYFDREEDNNYVFECEYLCNFDWHNHITFNITMQNDCPFH